MMTSASVYKAAGTFAASCLLLALTAFPTVAWAQVGYVHEVSGTVSIQKTPGKSMAAQVGNRFEPGTIFCTGINGKATLKFADGQLVVLSSDSCIRVGQYRFDAKNVRLSGSTVALMKGEMRFVTGVIGTDHPEGIQITAGISRIGILKPGGADFIVMVNPDPQEVGLAAVGSGEIAVRTPYGVIDKIASSQLVPWQPGRAPTSAPIAAAPAVIQATASALFATVVPANTPVDVASAAFAATFSVFVATATDPPQAEVSAGASEPSVADWLTLLANLPATAEGPAQAQVAAYAGGFPLGPVPPPVTSGGGGRCTGSVC